MRKIKPITEQRRFRNFIRRVFGIKQPSRVFAEYIGGCIDEMHELKADIDIPGTTTKKEPRCYYVRAEIIGELPGGQVRVHLLADGADGYNFYTTRKSLISEGSLFVKMPVDKPCPKCGHIDRYLGSLCEPQSVSIEIVETKEEAPTE